jgi:cell wall-associated NlpC family hydrolase
MFKKFAAMGLSVLLSVTYSPPAVAVTNKEITSLTETQRSVKLIFEQKVQDSFLRQEYLRNQTLIANSKKVSLAINKLEKTVGKTWYVFSGSTPSGWDCSGLTLWFYKQLDIELQHRASKQGFSGQSTKTPKPGDLVVFKYKGSKSAYHVGIYVGDDEMIHAPRKGEVTRVESIKGFGGNYSTISYRTIVDKI